MSLHEPIAFVPSPGGSKSLLEEHPAAYGSSTLGIPRSLAAHADAVSRSAQRVRTALSGFSTPTALQHAYEDAVNAQDELEATLVGMRELLHAA
jgi:hypothetical protein